MTDGHIGRVLANQYRLDSVLGKGGMGTVYRATQLSVDRPVAVKLISGDVARNPELIKRFRREAELMSKLEHPSIVRLYDFGLTDDGLLYLVMELINGGDLSHVLHRNGAFAPDRALRITLRILHALRKAHESGIVHRDLKPQNIITMNLDGDPDFVKIMDFGIARLHEADSQLTSTGAIMGTPAYMSPEQAQGVPVDARADLYSTGVILFVLLTGRIPFEANTAVAMLMKHVSQPPPRIHEVNPALAIAPAVQELLDRLLAKEPNDRPNSAAEAATLVHRALEATAAGQVFTAAQLPAVAAAPVGPHGLPRTQAAGVAAPRPDPMAAGGSASAVPQHSQMADSSQLHFHGGHTATAHQPYQPHAGGSRKTGAIAAAAAVIVIAVVLAVTLGGKSDKAAPVPGETETAGTPMETVTIASSPSNATIKLDGAELGTTPFDFKFRNATTLQVSADGFETANVTVEPGQDPTLVVKLEAIGGANVAGIAEPGDEDLAQEGLAKSSPAQPREKGAAARKDEPLEPEWEKPKTDRRAPGETGTSAVAGSVPEKKRTGLGGFIDRTTDTVGGIAGVGGLGDRRSRRAEMARVGPRYTNVASAKRAFDSGKISRTELDDIKWVLKSYRTKKRDHATKQLDAGTITQAQYDARLEEIERQYQGH